MSNNTTVISIHNHYELIAAQTPSWFHFTSGLILLTTTLVSLISNGSVVYALLVKDRKPLTRITMYVIGICCLNLFMASFGTPMVVISCFNKLWYFGESGCTYSGFLMTFLALASILLLTMISVDQYIYVVKHNLSKHLSIIPIVISISLGSVLTLGFSISPLIGWNHYTYEGVGTACAIDLIGENNNGQSFVLTVCALYFVLPVLVMTFAYGSIYAKVLKDAKNELANNRREDSEAKRKELRRKMTVEQKLAVTVSINIGFFLICYTPYAFIVIWKVLNTDAEIDPIAMAIPTMLTKVAGICTPFVYLSKNKAFREHMMNIYPCFRSKNRVHPCENIKGRPLITVSLKEETPSAHPTKAKEGNNSKHREDRHSTVAVYTVDTSDIYEYQKESPFLNIIPKSVVDITDTIDTESIIIISDV